MKLKAIGIIFFSLLAGVFVFQLIRIAYYGRQTVYTAIPFERKILNAPLKILFTGDSTAVGTGAPSNTQSVAGWFAQDLSDARIINQGRNGRRLKNLVADFHPDRSEHYRLVVLQIGANDIMHMTPVKNIERDLSVVIDRAKSVADQVVIMHSGDVGFAPIFSWPFNEILSRRTRDVRALYMKIAKEKNILYVDLYREKKDDLFLKDVDRYYSKDLLHPSGDGYRYWYERLRQTLKQSNIEVGTL